MATYVPSFKISNPIGPGPSLPPPAYGAAALQAQGIHETSTVQNYPLGTRVRAVDPVLGEAEFVYAKGVASTTDGEIVRINADYTTVRAAGGTVKGTVGISMSANVANQYGWYCVFGAVYGKIAADVAAAAPAYVSATAGTLTDAVTATYHVLGAMLAIGLNAGGSAIVGTTDTTPASRTVVRVQYPVVGLAV